MSDIVAFALSLLEEGEVLSSTFRNCDMKQLIVSHYGESVTVAPNSRVKEPTPMPSTFTKKDYTCWVFLVRHLLPHLLVFLVFEGLEKIFQVFYTGLEELVLWKIVQS